jgi:5-methylcytosine-specific restriction protein A
MPRAAHVCPEPGCVILVPSGTRYCPDHTRQRRPKDNRPNFRERGYTSEWDKLRKAYIAKYPNCVVCGKKGSHVDHIISRPQGTDDESNLQTLCWKHHSMKTAKYDGGFGNPRK